MSSSLGSIEAGQSSGAGPGLPEPMTPGTCGSCGWAPEKAPGAGPPGPSTAALSPQPKSQAQRRAAALDQVPGGLHSRHTRRGQAEACSEVAGATRAFSLYPRDSRLRLPRAGATKSLTMGSCASCGMMPGWERNLICPRLGATPERTLGALTPSGKLGSGRPPPRLLLCSRPGGRASSRVSLGYRLEALGKESSPRGQSSSPPGPAPQPGLPAYLKPLTTLTEPGPAK